MGEFRSQHLCRTAWAVAALASDDAPLLASIASSARRLIGQFNPMDLSGTAWAFAKLAECDRPLLDALASASLRSIADFKAQDLSNTAWSLATLDVRDCPLLDSIASAAISPIPSTRAVFNAQDLANTAWSFATLGILDSPLRKAISAAARRNIGAFRAQELANTAWAFASRGCADAPLFDSIAAAALARIGYCSPPELAATAWSFARLGFVNDPLFAAISSAAIPILSSFSPQHVANTAWSFAKLAVVDGPLIAALSAAAIPHMGQFAVQELANTAWAFSTLQVDDCPLRAAIADASIRKIAEVTCQGLATTASAFAAWQCGDRPLLEAIAAEALPKLAQGSLDAASEDPSRFTLSRVLNLVRALAAAGLLEEHLFSTAAAALQRHAGQLEGDSVQLGRPSEPRDGPADEPRVLLHQPRLCVVWKPPGWTVSVSDDESLSEQPAFQTGGSGRGLQDWIEHAFGADRPIARDAGASYGLAQRLDRLTSGSLLWGSCYSGYFAARLHLAARRVRKVYCCLCHGWLQPGLGLQEARLLVQTVRAGGQPPRSSMGGSRGMLARTEVAAAGHLACPEGGAVSLVEVRIHTGLMHQIRSHLSGLGHPLVGDAVYGSSMPDWCARMFLHARRLGIDIGDGPVDVEVPLPQDLRAALQQLTPLDQAACELLARMGRGALEPLRQEGR